MLPLLEWCPGKMFISTLLTLDWCLEWPYRQERGRMFSPGFFILRNQAHQFSKTTRTWKRQKLSLPFHGGLERLHKESRGVCGENVVHKGYCHLVNCYMKHNSLLQRSWTKSFFNYLPLPALPLALSRSSGKKQQHTTLLRYFHKIAFLFLPQKQILS